MRSANTWCGECHLRADDNSRQRPNALFPFNSPEIVSNIIAGQERTRYEAGIIAAQTVERADLLAGV